MDSLNAFIPVLEAIVSFIDEGVVIAEADGRVLYHNPAAAELLGLPNNHPLEHLSAVNAIDLPGPPDTTAADAAGDFVRLRRRLPTATGDRLLEFHTGLLEPTANGRRLRLIIISDRSPQEQLEAVLGVEGGTLVSRDPVLLELLQRVRQIAPTDAFVLLQGESGTGKTRLARTIHQHSLRAGGPFIEVNCAAIPESLIESELFGHVKGAFTGAHQERSGRFLAADGGTLFLDEVGEIPLALQAKLLRAVQEQAFEMVGSDRTQHVDVRVISASNRNLREQVDSGQFRPDLYYRLAVIPLSVPALRDRPGDIPLLIDHFCARLNERGYASGVRFSKAAMRLMMDYAWPGNVRELENAVEHGLICAVDGEVQPQSLPFDLRAQAGTAPAARAEHRVVEFSTSALQREQIIDALQRSGGRRSAAADLLGVDRSTLWRRMRRLGIS